MAILGISRGDFLFDQQQKRMQRALKTVTATVPESDLAMENPPVVSSYSRFSLSKGELLVGLEHFLFFHILGIVMPTD
jgi:hypothetical protein